MKSIISFDLDGTLVDARYGDAVWNHGVPFEYSKKYGISFEEAKVLVRKEYESVGDAHILWYELDYWLERFALAVRSEELLTRYESQIRALPHAEAVLRYLAGKYTLVIASNAARAFVEKELDYTGLARHFARNVSATTDYKVVKKQAQFYERLCRDLEVSPTQLVHVGDHAIFDYDAPSSLGIECYHFIENEVRPAEGIRNGRKIITTLKELLEIL